jgi:phage gp36-like protein
MYITYEDLKTGINEETLAVITRNQNNAAQAIREAEAEVRTYLCVRYDIDAELRRTGDSRDATVFRLVRDIALYRCYAISNPTSMPEIRRQNYEDALKLLRDIQGERASLSGLTRLDSGSQGSNYVKYGGNTKRKNKWV